jgi:hypothetical protein
VARLAALRTKQEEAQQLAAILDQVRQRNVEARELLEGSRAAARELVARAGPLQEQLTAAQEAATPWVSRPPGALAS